MLTFRRCKIYLKRQKITLMVVKRYSFLVFKMGPFY
jgi:hypothetical protein